MNNLQKILKKKPCVAMYTPVLLCFVAFVMTLFNAIRSGSMDANAYHQLLSLSDGFETVIMLAVMLVFKQKKK